jgi:hypothetical protein
MYTVVLLLLLAFCGAAGAQTFVVDDTGDAPDAAHGDGVCAIAVDHTCTLRAAIEESNELAGQQTVELGAGIHSIAIGGADEDAAATGDFDVTDDLVIAGLSMTASIVDGEGFDRVFDVADDVLVTITDLTIRGGVVTGADGGALRAGADALVLVARVALVDNLALGVNCDPFPACGGAGGAIAFGSANASNGPTLLMIQSRLAANRGGGVIVLRNAIAQLTDVTVEDHVDTVLHAYQSEVTLERCSIHGNRSAGSILRLSDDEPTLIQNSTISRNFADVSIVSAPGPLTLRNVTMAENGSDYGLAVEGALEIQNSVVADFLMLEQCHEQFGGSVTSLGHNADVDGSCTSLGSDLTLDDPRLGPLADNGGATQTHLPLPDSPLIDAAEDADCPVLDQRREDRPQDGDGDGSAHCDIGAVEVPEPAPPALLTTSALALAGLARARRTAPGPIQVAGGRGRQSS